MLFYFLMKVRIFVTSIQNVGKSLKAGCSFWLVVCIDGAVCFSSQKAKYVFSAVLFRVAIRHRHLDQSIYCNKCSAVCCCFELVFSNLDKFRCRRAACFSNWLATKKIYSSKNVTKRLRQHSTQSTFPLFWRSLNNGLLTTTFHQLAIILRKMKWSSGISIISLLFILLDSPKSWPVPLCSVNLINSSPSPTQSVQSAEKDVRSVFSFGGISQQDKGTKLWNFEEKKQNLPTPKVSAIF